MAKIIRILTYTANDADLRDHMRKRGVKGEKEITPGIHISEVFIDSDEFSCIDGVGINADDVILDTFVGLAWRLLVESDVITSGIMLRHNGQIPVEVLSAGGSWVKFANEPDVLLASLKAGGWEILA